jgi:hypothetical protein
MLNKILIITAAALLTQPALAGHVSGYTRANGTHVAAYERSAPNHTALDNYSYQGNTNPYTGSTGTSTRLDQGDTGYGIQRQSQRSNSQSNSYDSDDTTSQY